MRHISIPLVILNLSYIKQLFLFNYTTVILLISHIGVADNAQLNITMGR